MGDFVGGGIVGRKAWEPLEKILREKWRVALGEKILGRIFWDNFWEKTKGKKQEAGRRERVGGVVFG